MKIAAAVIWYNPTKECINNISTYLEYIDQLYIIDNSNENYSHLLNDIGSLK